MKKTVKIMFRSDRLITLIVLLHVLAGAVVAQPRHYDGIDVSHHQGVIEWEKVCKNKRLQFVYIKASEGRDYQDPRYAFNIRNARENKMKVGSYHFFHMSSTAREQFNNFKKMVKADEQDLIPMIDVEFKVHRKRGYHIDSYYVNNEKQRKAIVSRLRELVDLVESHYGCKPMIYCNLASYEYILEGAFDSYPLYVGNYRDSELNIANCLIWQYSSAGRIQGIHSESGKAKVCDVAAFYNGGVLADITIGTQKVIVPQPKAQKAKQTAKTKTAKKVGKGKRSKASAKKKGGKSKKSKTPAKKKGGKGKS